MSGLQNKNIIFYSMVDEMSRQCLKEIDQNESLRKQFIKVCIHHPQNPSMPALIRLPKQVLKLKEKNIIPVLAVAGFSKVILAGDALTWLQDNALKALNDGVSACNIGSSTADNCSTIAQTEIMGSELFGTEYNMGFADGKGETGKNYSNIDESSQQRIATFDDISNKKRASSETARRLELIKNQRDVDVPATNQRVSGFQMPIAPQRPAPMQMGGFPQAPQAPQVPQVPHMGIPNYAMSMPMMPARPPMPPQHQHQHQHYGMQRY